MLARSNSDRSPLYDVRNPARRASVTDGAPCEAMFSRTMALAMRTLAIIGRRRSLVGPPFALSSYGAAAFRYHRARRAEAGVACEGWWSQTGSNRRPHACKARALPAELWPRTRRRRLAGLPSRSSRQPARRRPLGSGAAARARCASEGWWAWEDLNFRPHAYQARALTT